MSEALLAKDKLGRQELRCVRCNKLLAYINSELVDILTPEISAKSKALEIKCSRCEYTNKMYLKR